MTTQKKLPVVTGLAIAVALAAGVYICQRPASTSPALGEHIRATREASGIPSVLGHSVLDEARLVPAGTVGYKKEFAQSHNYWSYAHKILPAAEAGDADAQFYLAQSIDRCNEDNQMYFQLSGAALTLDEGLQYAAKRHLPVEMAQLVYERCHEFQNYDPAELGNAADWLAKATIAGQPLAQTTTAIKIFNQNSKRSFTQAEGVLAVDAPLGPEMDPRALLRAAVESKDPEVIFDIGTLQGVLDSASPVEELTTRFAWWLVACQRGLDCTANAEWVKNSCFEDPQCASASSPSDLMRGLSGENWFAVQQRAQKIEAKLIAGDWSALGLGF